MQGKYNISDNNNPVTNLIMLVLIDLCHITLGRQTVLYVIGFQSK